MCLWNPHLHLQRIGESSCVRDFLDCKTASFEDKAVIGVVYYTKQILQF